MRRNRLFETFWEHFTVVPATGCWEWNRARIPKGYGCVFDPRTGTNRGVHVVAYELSRGLPPQPHGFVVRHLVCDNPPCGNPEHLEGGTTADNHHDAMSKGRNTRGVKQAKARLNDALVASAKTLLAEGTKIRAVAAALNVDRCTIADIVAGRTWTFVSPGTVPAELRVLVEASVKRCKCGCGRILTAQCKYGFAWGCPNRPSNYKTRAEDLDRGG